MTKQEKERLFSILRATEYPLLENIGCRADQSGNTDTVGEGQAAEKVVLGARH